jgi:hypothetical protein
MKIKRFSINESYPVYEETTFAQKMEEDYDILNTAKGIIRQALESIDVDNVSNSDEFDEALKEKINIDETDLINFSIDKEIDLCIYAEENEGGSCPETPFELLTTVIGKYAMNGLNIIVDNILTEKILTPFNEFMEANNLDYSDISMTESYGHSAPKSVKSIKNGEIYQYRKLDGDFDVDEYMYQNDEFKLEIYIKKIL